MGNFGKAVLMPSVTVLTFCVSACTVGPAEESEDTASVPDSETELTPASQEKTAAEAADVAAAASGMQRVDACFSGACGSATYKRTGSSSFNPIKLSVKDNKCDNHPAYIQVGVNDHRVEPVWLNTKHYNHLGCHGGYATWDTYLEWPAPIAELLVRVCVDDAGSDTCKIAL